MLIAFSTVIDFAIGLQIAKSNQELERSPLDVRSKQARKWLLVSLVVNLGLLGYFKYANFFLESWVDAWSSMDDTIKPLC